MTWKTVYLVQYYFNKHGMVSKRSTISSVQLAHTKVGVGVTQANLGHGWPKFSPMDGLLGLSIPYLGQNELAFLTF